MFVHAEKPFVSVPAPIGAQDFRNFEGPQTYNKSTTAQKIMPKFFSTGTALQASIKNDYLDLNFHELN